MPRRLAEGLRDNFGENATHAYHHFGYKVLDPTVLRFIGEKGWFLVSRDRMIMRRAHEHHVLKQMGIGAFFLDSPLDDFCTIVRATIRNWPEMKRLAATQPRPFVYLVKHRSVIPFRNRHIR